MLTRDFAEHFAADWIAAWNAHDLEHILAHYADFGMSSPYTRGCWANPRARSRARPRWATTGAVRSIKGARLELKRLVMVQSRELFRSAGKCVEPDRDSSNPPFPRKALTKSFGA
jgi:hypothetical protein